jgi:hypothetical protein
VRNPIEDGGGGDGGTQGQLPAAAAADPVWQQSRVAGDKS